MNRNIFLTRVLQTRPASWEYNSCSHPGPLTQKDFTLGFMLCHHPLEILNNFWKEPLYIHSALNLPKYIAQPGHKNSTM